MKEINLCNCEPFTLNDSKQLNKYYKEYKPHKHILSKGKKIKCVRDMLSELVAVAVHYEHTADDLLIISLLERKISQLKRKRKK